MPKVPFAKPIEARCDQRLPEAALSFRKRNAPSLTTLASNTSPQSISLRGYIAIGKESSAFK